MTDYEIPQDLNIKISVIWFLKLLYLAGIVLFGGLTILVFTSQAIGPSLLLAGFTLLVFWTFLLSFTTIVINHDSIIVSTPHGIYKIGWNEVRVIETNGVSFAFVGEEKCLPINLSMAGKGKKEFYRFMEKIDQSGKITVKPLTPQSMKQRNTKIHHPK
jgi:hypothetical protein